MPYRLNNICTIYADIDTNTRRWRKKREREKETQPQSSFCGFLYEGTRLSKAKEKRKMKKREKERRNGKNSIHRMAH